MDMSTRMITLLLVEDNARLRPAMKRGLEATGAVTVIADFGSGEEALADCLQRLADSSESAAAVLMDVQLAGVMNGIEAAVAIRREMPRHPVVFYSIQDDDAYYRAFRRAGILSHYAYVRKSNFLLPEMLVPLLRDAIAGRSFIDPDIENRVQAVRQKDAQSPMALLEPNEQEVALMLAQGLSNRQIADRMGFRDKRTISRINGQIYTAFDLNATSTEEKVARTRVAIIINAGRLLQWDELGHAFCLNERDEWVAWEGE